ncbi:hypothetical protein GCM10011581_43530 [Saccharopolyspora subtropica]|uniref:Uncharacterized protein n=1 Tax=Saccharopolyspora thermophila TaxID=89367 RepID=A0A917NHR0_9PSEU|nr:hypothetical protein [Saccharopolyspora subtropica]GGJ01607.1 hypothetical protein GCM10011581_43530 [Saccharopolyspora subtropica]
MEIKIPGLARNTPVVSRLEKIGDVIDELDRALDEVEFLEDDIVDKRAFQTAQDLAGKARAALTGVRDGIGKKGGPSVAKGYKK